ncbi:MAG: TlpA disulfide reductase family protein [Opitutaceae bacterium]
MNPRPLVFRLLLPLMLLGLVGCAPREKEKPASTAASTTAAPWRLKDLAGRDVTLSQFRGKVVVLDFWATWCPPCRREMPDYIALQKKYGERGLVIVGISLDAQGPGVVKTFTESLGVNYVIVMGDSDIAEAYQVEAMPTTFLIDREGHVRHRKVGSLQDVAAYEAQIESLL